MASAAGASAAGSTPASAKTSPVVRIGHGHSSVPTKGCEAAVLPRAAPYFSIRGQCFCAARVVSRLPCRAKSLLCLSPAVCQEVSLACASTEAVGGVASVSTSIPVPAAEAARIVRLVCRLFRLFRVRELKVRPFSFLNFRVFRVRELAGRSGSASETPPLNPPRR